MPRANRPSPRSRAPGDIEFAMREVIRGQIDGAIDLCIRFDNLIAAYLLAATAINNLWSTAKSEGVNLPLDLARMAREKKPEIEKSLMAKFHQAYNELKHIGSSSFQTHLHPASVEAHILTASLSFNHFFSDTTPKMAIYQNWMMHRHPFLRAPDYEPVKDFADIDESSSRTERAAPARKLLEHHDANPATMDDMIELVRRVRAMKFAD